MGKRMHGPCDTAAHLLIHPTLAPEPFSAAFGCAEPIAERVEIWYSPHATTVHCSFKLHTCSFLLAIMNLEHKRHANMWTLFLKRRRKFTTSIQPAKAYEDESVMMSWPH